MPLTLLIRPEPDSVPVLTANPLSPLAQTFAVNASGHDTLVTYGTTGDFVSVVLVGIDQGHLPAALSNHALTLG
jgi:hypothetical protein